VLSLQERLAVIDRATDTIEVEGQTRSFTNVQRIRDELWHSWALSEAQVDNEIRTMYQNNEIRDSFVRGIWDMMKGVS